MDAPEEKIHEKLTDEYREKRELYSDFCIKIGSILEQVLKDNGFKYQIVSPRAKKVASAASRFKDYDCKKLSDLKDLAGCRVIFYLESDINTFIQHIQETFGKENILKIDSKVSIDGYNAVHVDIKLGKDRLAYPEYKGYDGLQCEIQLTTILHHAWSEMEHDIIYKPPKELTEFHQKAHDVIKQGFKDVMQKHIQPAMRDFEYLYKEHEKLREGKSVFDLDFLKKIEETGSLNELKDNLDLLQKYIQKFGDKTPKELPLIELLKKTLIRAKTLKKKPIKTVFGNFDGTSYGDVAFTVMRILNDLRYWHQVDVCSICFEILKTEKSEAIQKEASSILENVAKYNLQILRSEGRYKPQEELISLLKREAISGNKNLESVAISILKEILTLSFNGVEVSNYKSITFQPTTLNPTPKLKSIRKQSITLLKSIFFGTKDLQVKRNVILAFEHALRWPDYDVSTNADNVEKLIDRDTKDVLNFYKEIIDTEDNEILSEIAKHLMFLSRNPKRKTPQVDSLLVSLLKNKDYQTYRIFVGYDTDFFPDFDFEKAKLHRDGKINDFVEEISKVTLENWKKILKKVVKNYKNVVDFSLYSYLHTFLFQLGKEKPEIALLLINEKYLEPLIIHIVAGVWKSKKKASAVSLVEKWCKEGKNLVVCAAIFDYVEEIDKNLFTKIMTKALEKKDIRTLNTLVSSIGRNYSGEKWLRQSFIKIVTALTTLENTLWTQRIWFRSSIIDDLSISESKAILNNLVLHKRIDFDTEEILRKIAEKYPEEFMKFLLERVKISITLKPKQRGKPTFDQYDAIPHSLNKLADPLHKHAKIIIPEILRWFSLGKPKEDQWVYRWEASHLLKEVFSNSHPELESGLKKIIKRKGKDGIMVVDEFISRFEGQDFLWKLVEEIVNSYKNETEYESIKNKLFGYLSQTGVVSGEYGFVDAFKNKKDALSTLKATSTGDFLLFVNEYKKYLDKQITVYHKMADDDIDSRKREFGE